MGPQSTPACDQIAACLLSAAFIARQRLCEISFRVSELIDKSLGIQRSLGDAGTDVRPSDEGRVADQHDTTKRHARRFEIEDGGQDRFVRARDQFRQLRGQKPTSRQLEFGDHLLPNQRRRYRIAVAVAGRVRAPPPQGRTVLGRAEPYEHAPPNFSISS
jgi:hypothetical protein